MIPTNSEWMKVMLDEIARKKLEAEQDQLEFERRLAEQRAAGSGEPVREGPPA
jgi:hypothetical protein